MKKSVCCSLLLACAVLQAGTVAARSNYIPRTERGRLAEAIVLRWSAEGAKAHGTTEGGWARAMAGALGHAPIEQLRKAASAARLQDAIASLQMGTFAVGQGSIFHTVSACRILDTGKNGRFDGGFTSAFVGIPSVAGFPNYEFQGGSPTDCGVPANATALALQVTASGADVPGTLSLFPAFSDLVPQGPNIIYPIGAQATGLVLVNSTGQGWINAFTTQTVHVIADVVGYYSPAAVTQACVNSPKSTVTVVDGSQGTGVVAPACPSGTTRVAVRCMAGNKQATLLGTDENDKCVFADTTTNGIAGSGTAVSKCCSVSAN